MPTCSMMPIAAILSKRRSRGQIAVVEELHAGPPLEPGATDPRLRVLGLRAPRASRRARRRRSAPRPTRRGSPSRSRCRGSARPAARRSFRHTRSSLSSCAVVEVAVGAPVVGAGVDHARVEEERVEVVRDVVVVADGLAGPGACLRSCMAHPIPKAPSRTRRRRSPGRVQASRAAATMRKVGKSATRDGPRIPPGRPKARVDARRDTTPAGPRADRVGGEARRSGPRGRCPRRRRRARARPRRRRARSARRRVAGPLATHRVGVPAKRA